MHRYRDKKKETSRATWLCSIIVLGPEYLPCCSTQRVWSVGVLGCFPPPPGRVIPPPVVHCFSHSSCGFPPPSFSSSLSQPSSSSSSRTSSSYPAPLPHLTPPLPHLGPPHHFPLVIGCVVSVPSSSSLYRSHIFLSASGGPTPCRWGPHCVGRP